MSTKISNTYFSVAILVYAMLAYFSVVYAKVSKCNAYANFSAPNKPSLRSLVLASRLNKIDDLRTAMSTYLLAT